MKPTQQPGNPVLVTGATGAVGTPLAEAIGPCFILKHRLSEPHLGFDSTDRKKIRCIVHAAADTRFNNSRKAADETNVRGTENVLRFARSCPRFEHFIHLSTTCVAGDLEGIVAEEPILERPEFHNHYEASKWEAEQLVLNSGLPVTILRLATVIGDEKSGTIARPGAIHHCLNWLRKGLIPMLPGKEDTRLDIISTDHVVRAIIKTLHSTASSTPTIAHLSGGDRAPLLKDLIPYLASVFQDIDPLWRRGIINPPDIVDAETFAAFRKTSALNSDLLFRHITEICSHFLPGLLHPKQYLTTNGDRLRDTPADWRSLVKNVIRNQAAQ